MRLLVPLVTLALLPSCGGTSDVGGSGGGGGSTSGAGGATTSSSGGGGSTGTSGGGCAGVEPPIAQLCVRGEPSGQGEEITAGTSVRIELRPEGCFSSSCTEVHAATCDLVSQQGTEIVVDGAFCLEGTGDRQCTADCGGGGTATCEIGSMPEGGYTASYDMLSVPFTIPMTLPFGGECAGNPF